MTSHEAPLEPPAQTTAQARVALHSEKATTQPIAPAEPASPLRRTSGYLADPDGHVWEIAHNPFWPLDEDGALTLP